MSKEKQEKAPVVDVAKKVASQKNGANNMLTLATGDRVKIMPVSASLIDEVTNLIDDPTPPMWYNENKDREEPNEFDPGYLRAVRENERQRAIAAMDAMVMFGVELIDGVPQDDRWMRKLRLMEKRGQLDLSKYDVNDEIDLEFLYKRYIAVSPEIVTMIGEISGITAQEVEQAEDSFPGQ